MSATRKLGAACAAAVLAFVAASAHAERVDFTYTTTIDNSAIPGVSAGDVFTLTVEADNGSGSLASQAWTIGDLLSAHVSAGSYVQDDVGGWFSPDWSDPASFVVFTTDAAGGLTANDFLGTNGLGGRSDSFGSGGHVYLASNAVVDYFGREAFLTAWIPDTPAGWSLAAAPVPEPSPAALLAAGLGVLGLSRRRRHRA